MQPTSLTTLPKTSQAGILLRCLSYLRPHWKLTAGAYLMMLLIDGISMLSPQLIRWTIDRGIRLGDTPLLTLAVLALLGLVVIRGVFTYFQGRWTEIASQSVAFDIRNELRAA